MFVIDTHSHLFTSEFAEDLPEVIARAKEAGVGRIYMPNIDVATVQDLLQVCETYDGYCLPMLGLHPTSVSGEYKSELSELRRLLENPHHPFVAIGEVGLDLYWDRTFCQEQKDAFREQIEWAIAFDLPLVIHSRSAFQELVAIMEEYRNESLKGIFHSFSGTKEEAERLLSFKGFMLGINGALTFKKSTLPSVLSDIPLERVVLETDAPYLAPVPFRGKRNESAYIKFTLAHLASVYGVSTEIVAKTTTENAKKVFGNGGNGSKKA